MTAELAAEVPTFVGMTTELAAEIPTFVGMTEELAAEAPDFRRDDSRTGGGGPRFRGGDNLSRGWQHYKSAKRSRQVGLNLVINSSFQARLHFFNCFSRRIASVISICPS